MKSQKRKHDSHGDKKMPNKTLASGCNPDDDLDRLIKAVQAGRGRTIVHMIGLKGTIITAVHVPGARNDVAVFRECSGDENADEGAIELMESIPEFYPLVGRAKAWEMAKRGYLPKHGNIFRAIRTVFQSDGSLDAHRLTEYLDNSQKLEKCGGVNYIVNLAEEVPSALEGPHYAAIVKGHGEARGIIRIADAAISACYKANPDNDKIVDDMSLALSYVVSRNSVSGPEQIGDVVESYLSELKQREPGELPGLLTGYAKVADLLNDEGLVARSGGAWRASSVYDILKREGVRK